MKREEALRRIRDGQSKLVAFPIKHLAVFGSVARNEASEGSDVDILVEFEQEAHVGLFEFARLRRTLAAATISPRALGMTLCLVVMRVIQSKSAEVPTLCSVMTGT